MKTVTMNRYFSTVVFLIFVAELFLSGIGNSQLGLVLAMLLFIEFLTLDDRTVDINKVNNSFFFSIVLASFFSITQGFVGGGVERTATMVDGSIAVVTIAILLFSPQFEEKGRINTVLYTIILACSFIVLLFGMSRSRIILVIGMLIIKSVLGRKKQSNRTTVALIIGILLVLFFLFESSIGEMLIRSISGRFEGGLESEGRDDEILFGLNLFTANPLWGAGWRELSFIDYLNQTSGYSHHCMYVAILARGGLVLSIPVFCTVFLLLKDAIGVFRINKLPLILMAAFLLLAYGNAGFLNYTICSFFIPIVINLQKSKHDKNNVYHQ